MKKTNTIALMIGMLLFVFATPLYSQTPTSCSNIVNTGMNHTVIFSNSTVTLNGTPLPNGSFIIVIFDNNGTPACGGFTMWNGSNTVIAAFGDNTSSPNKDGFSTNEAFKYRIELPNGAVIEDVDITVTYYPIGGIFANGGNYVTNGITGIQSLIAGTGNPVDCPVLGLNIGDLCNDADPNTLNDEVDANCNCTGVPSCQLQDSLLLIDLYNAAGGANWANSWNLFEPISAWHGITLNNSGCVLEIDLADNNLVGTIPPGLGQLASLTTLNLGTKIGSNLPPQNTNQLTGNIPPQLGSLSNLEILDLSLNHLTGSIPPILGQLSNLTELWLNVNNLSGNIPPELGELSNLKTLQIGGNGLTGNIPPELGQLSSINTLVLDNCLLTGTIPSELGQLTQIQIYLGLGNNQLTGSIPPELGQLSSLDRLNLRNNQLSGGIPQELGMMSNLANMSIYNNQLTGSIPAELGQLSKLRILRLQNNQLTGSIPSVLGQLSKFIFIELQDNLLTGNIPTSFGMLNLLRQLDLSNNNLNGAIPGGLGQLPDLTLLHLNDNNLSGCYPVFTNSICQSFDYDFTSNPLLPFQGDYSQICNGENEIGAPCDDGDPGTSGETIQPDCSCGVSVTPPDCPLLGLDIGDGCDDGDSCTINDKVDANCNCIGTFQDTGNACESNLTLTCPPDISVTAPNGQNTAIVNYPAPVSNSDCQTGNISINLGAGLASGAAFPLGETLLAYIAADGCGNNVACSFRVNVTQGQVGLDCNGINISVSGNNITVGGLTGPINEVQVFNNDWTNKLFSCFESCNTPTVQVPNLSSGTYHVIAKFYGTNYQLICERNQDVEISGGGGGSGTSVLSLKCPPKISVTAPNGQAGAIVNYNAPTAHSTCAQGSVSLQRIAGLESGSVFPTGTSIITYQATDGCGDSKTCSFMVTVQSAPGGGGGNCDDVTITNGGGIISIGGLTAPVNEVQVYTQDWSTSVYSCFLNCNEPTQVLPTLANGTYQVIVKFYSSNYQPICEKTQDIVVGGSTGSNLSLICPGNVNATAQLGQGSAVVNYTAPSATSSCTTGSVSLTRIAGFPSGASFPVGTTTVTYRAVDGCGNVQHCSFQVTVAGGQGAGDCSSVQISVNDDSIVVNGLLAPITEVQVLSGNWSTLVYSCFDHCNMPQQVISKLDPGVYHVIVKFYNSSYQTICELQQDAVIGPDASYLAVFDFDATLQDDVDVGLFWVNSTQQINDYFIVEKSTNGIDYEPLLQKDGKADLNSPKIYRDIDRNPVRGNNFYRIKLVYVDGSYTYSKVKIVSFNPESDFTLFPNPATDRIRIYMERFIGKEVDVVIITPQGQVVFKKHIDTVKDAIFLIGLDRDLFREGIYSVSVVHKGRAISKRMVIARFD